MYCATKICFIDDEDMIWFNLLKFVCLYLRILSLSFGPHFYTHESEALLLLLWHEFNCRLIPFEKLLLCTFEVPCCIHFQAKMSILMTTSSLLVSVVQ